MDAEQLSFCFLFKDEKNLKNIFSDTFLEVRRKIKKMPNESVEDYIQYLKDETLLEVAHKLVEMATYRDNINIELKYGRGIIKNGREY